jgi:hypothetical protein
MIVAIRRAIACSWQAWHEVPGGPVPRVNCPVGSGMISLAERRSTPREDRLEAYPTLVFRASSDA